MTLSVSGCWCILFGVIGTLWSNCTSILGVPGITKLSTKTFQRSWIPSVYSVPRNSFPGVATNVSVVECPNARIIIAAFSTCFGSFASMMSTTSVATLGVSSNL